MAKATKAGGEKIEFKKAAAAQKLYWETLVGKKKLSVDQLPESFSFNLYQLKAYLNEVEAEFTKLNVPYADRSISILPIAYSEKERISITFTPSVPDAAGVFHHQFNKKPKAKKAAKNLADGEPSYDFQLPSLNYGTDNP